MMLLRLLKVASQAERSDVVAIMNKPRSAKTPADVELILGMMKRYDTIGYAQKRASELLNEALGYLGNVKMRGDRSSVEMLQSVARFAIERQW